MMLYRLAALGGAMLSVLYGCGGGGDDEDDDTPITTAPTTYSIGGSITGLQGSGLTLRLNGSTDPAYNFSPASSATGFSFQARLASGATYAVSVVAQPTSPAAQICLVSNGGGTVGASNVSSVTVTCATGSYTVGGTVSGLTGAGLSLGMGYQTSTAPSIINVNANGGFTFPVSVPSNAAFGVSVNTQPAGQSCTIVRGRGASTANNNITDIAVACINNSTPALTGTYSGLDGVGRQYVNLHANGTYTTALIHNAQACNAGGHTRNGNGVEFGVFAWNAATSAFTPLTPAAVDTNGGCGFSDAGDFSNSFTGLLQRSGNNLAVIENGVTLITLSGIVSTSNSLTGAYVVPGVGVLLVLHADGTFMLAETQTRGSAPSGQERGCYTADTSAQTLTFTIAGNCTPDGFPAYDLNGAYGLFFNPAGVVVTTTGAIPYSIDSNAGTFTLAGIAYQRTQPY